MLLLTGFVWCYLHRAKHTIEIFPGAAKVAFIVYKTNLNMKAQKLVWLERVVRQEDVDVLKTYFDSYIRPLSDLKGYKEENMSQMK